MNHLDFSIIQLTTIREALLHVLDEGRLLPDGTRAPWMFYPVEPQCTHVIPQTGCEACLKACMPDWHMDESGDVNEQRTQFCDAVQTYLVKEAQKANVEIIDHKAF